MTHQEVIFELEKINLKKEYVSVFESNFSQNFKNRVNELKNINSVGSVLRVLLNTFDYKSKEWNFWHNVYLYFITPEYAREVFNIENLKK